MTQNIRQRGAPPSRGRGGSRAQHMQRNSNSTPTNVPSAHQVLPGVGVSIVLKIDQPSGNEVQGIVGEVLGRGNHPRGIKVRLQDGRVGRVQHIAGDGLSRASTANSVSLGSNGEVNGSEVTNRVARSSLTTTGSSSHFEDIRNDPYDYSSACAVSRGSLNLEDFMKKPSRNRKKRGTSKNQDSTTEVDSTTTSALVHCPICGDFEGDEGAVAFHVDSHFD